MTGRKHSVANFLKVGYTMFKDNSREKPGYCYLFFLFFYFNLTAIYA